MAHTSTGDRDWCRKVRELGVLTVATAMGGIAPFRGRDPLKAGLSPCPACGKEIRHRNASQRSQTGAVYITPDGLGWRCYADDCGAKGDAVSLASWLCGERGQVTGAVRQACEDHGLLTAELQRVKPQAAPEKPVWAPGEAHDLWNRRLDGLNRAMAEEGYLFFQRQFPAENWRLIESGYCAMTADDVGLLPESVHRWVGPFLEQHGPVFVAPLRSAQTNMVEALHLRSMSSKERRTVGATNANGVPFGYGWAGAALRCDTVVLCEGMADTMAAEALLRDAWPDGGIVAVGAVNANALGSQWASWLSQRKRGRVVVVHHRDMKNGQWDVSAAGQKAAIDLVNHLRLSGVAADIMRWSRLIPPGDESNKDLCGVLMTMGSARWNELKTAFAAAVGMAAGESRQ